MPSWRVITTHIPRSLHSRPILRYPGQLRSNHVRFNHSQPVYVREKIFSRKKLLLIFVNGALAYGVTRLISRKLGSLLGDEEIQQILEEEEDEGEEEIESLFVPLSWPKKLPRRPYRQSDEDWQMFISLSKDPQKKKAIGVELANRIARDVARDETTRRMLGQKIRLSKYWLDIKFPDSPPPEYERLALEWTDDYIAISSQVIPQSKYVMLNHFMRPVPAWVALKQSAKQFCRCHTARLKTALGLELSDRDQKAVLLYKLVRDVQRGQFPQDAIDASGRGKALEHLLKQLVPKAQPEQTSQPAREAQSSQSMTTGLPSIISTRVWERINSTFNPFASASSSSASSTPPSSAASQGTNSSSALSKIFPPFEFPPSLRIAAYVFRTQLAMGWTGSRIDSQPKGTFFVVGEVEVIGDRARAKCDVRAAYDPKQGKYIWVMCNVKELWELQQTAKGGP